MLTANDRAAVRLLMTGGEMEMMEGSSLQKSRLRRVADIGHEAGDFVLWLLKGVGYALALVSILTIGLLVLPVPLAATVLVSRRPGLRLGVAGLLAGLGLPFVYVAFINRAGPGTVCATATSGSSCVEQLSPWPWLAVGLVLLASGAVAFGAQSHDIRTQAPPRAFRPSLQ